MSDSYPSVLAPGPNDEEAFWHQGYDREEAARLTRAPEHEDPPFGHRFTDGGSFVLDAPDKVPTVWGSGSDVVWPQGEALIIFGPDGVGKTTAELQLIRARIGLDEEFLGYPVAPTASRVLWLLMDRPAQGRRAAARIFTEADRTLLSERLVVWEGPPPYDMAKRTDTLAAMAKDAGADTVFLDSLKDAALGLSDDEVGAGYNRARQKALAEGIEVLELHHPVKGGPGEEPTELRHMYGSRWIGAGAGSVINLHGNPGDPIITMRHRKFPMNEIGPFTLAHDHTTGRTTIHHVADLVAMVRVTGPEGLTARAAAEALFEVKTPDRGQVEKARRRLADLEKTGHLVQMTGQSGGVTKATTWHLAAGG